MFNQPVVIVPFMKLSAARKRNFRHTSKADKSAASQQVDCGVSKCNCVVAPTPLSILRSRLLRRTGALSNFRLRQDFDETSPTSSKLRRDRSARAELRTQPLTCFPSYPIRDDKVLRYENCPQPPLPAPNGKGKSIKLHIGRAGRIINHRQ